MEYINDRLGHVVLAVDHENLYYHNQEVIEVSKLEESISFVQLRLGGNGGLKLKTILDFQLELEVITDLNFVISAIKKNSPVLSEIIQEYEDVVTSLNERIVLLELEGSGPASAWRDYLYLTEENQFFTLNSSRKGLQSASEIIEYYGFGDNDYWDQIQANGEFIVESILVRNGKDLFDAIALAFENEEQWNGMNDVIDWATIVDVLLDNKSTLKLGI